jgi:hypothetical protein
MEFRKLFLIMMLFSYALSINHIMKHKSFPLFETFAPALDSDREFRTCFSGLSPSANYILLIENTVKLDEYIKDIADNSSEHKMMDVDLFLFDSKEIINTNALFHSDRNMISIELLQFTPSPTAWYCLEFTYMKEKTTTFNPFKNLKIVASSSNEDSRIEYSLDANIASNIVFYSFSNQGLNIVQTTPSKASDLKRNDSFSITYEMNLNLENANKRLWTKESIILKITSSDIIFTDSVESTPASNFTENTKILDKITFNKKIVTIAGTTTSYLMLDRFDTNWHSGRTFKLTLNNLTFLDKNKCSSSTSEYKIKFELLWRNTNSVISSLETESGVSCTHYTIDEFRVRHESFSTMLYTGASWPLVFNMRVSEQLTNHTIRLRTGSTNVIFLSATCKITSTGSNPNTFCEQSNSTSEEMRFMRIRNVSAPKSSQIEIKVWIMINDVKPTINNGIGKYCLDELGKFTADIIYPQNESLFTNSKDIDNLCSSLNSFRVLISNDYTNAYACIEGSSSTDLCLFRVENTGNFKLNSSNESSNTPDSLWNFKSPNTKPFDLTVTSASAPLRSLWATENVALNTPYTEAGTHLFYFPTNFSVIANTSTCKTTSSKFNWKSNKSFAGSAITTDFTIYNPSITTNALNANTANNVTILDNTSSGSSLIAKITINTPNVAKSVGIFNFLHFKLTSTSNVITEGTPTENVASNVTDINFSFNFSCINTRYVDFNYTHQAYDLVHLFQGESSTGRKIVRMNRFISLMFQSTFFNNQHSESSYDFVRLHTVSTANTTGICILVLDLTKEQLDNNTSFIVNSLLLKFLDFENMSQYPILNASSVKVATGVYNNFLPSTFNTNSDGQHYNNFLYSYMEFVPIFDSSTNAAIIMTPLKCNIESELPNSIFNFLATKKTTNSSLLYQSVKKYYVNDDYSRNVESLAVTGELTYHYSREKWGLNLFPNSTQQTGNLTITKTSNPTKYFALFGNYKLNPTDLSVLDANDVSFDYSTSLLKLSITNKLKIGSSFYSNGVLFYRNEDMGTIITKTVEGTSTYYPEIKLLGLDYPAKTLSESIENNIHFSFYLNNEGNRLTFPSSTKLSFKSLSPFTLTNSNVSVKIFTSGIKTPSENFTTASSQYICATFDITMQRNTNIVKLSNNVSNINSNTVCESKSGTKIDVDGSSSITITNPNFEPRITVHCCNLTVSSTNKIDMKVDFYSADLSLNSYTNSKVTLDPIISSSNYNVNVVSTLRYEPITDNFSYNRMCLTVNLDHEIFRYMKVVISNSQLISLETDSSIPVRCEAFVNIIPGDKNRLFKNCIYNSSLGTITVTTRKVVEITTSMDKKFDVCIWPIIAKNISEKFTTSVYFDNGDELLLFPNDATLAVTPKISNTNVICNMTGLITSIKPYVSGFTSNLRIVIDESNNQIFNACMEFYSNNSVNEISLFFPSSVYGIVEESVLSCYVNDTNVPNCIYENDWINLRVSVGFSEAINIDIYGFKVLQEDQLPTNANSRILIKANSISNTSILTLAQGKASFSDAIIRSKFTEPKPEDSINLAITKVSYSITDSSIPPNTNVDITLVGVLDDLGGAYGKSIERSSLKDSNIIIQLPRDLRFSQSSTIKVNDYMLPDSIEEFTESVVRDYEFETISIYGRTIQALVSNDLILNNKVLSFVFVITNVVTSYSNQIFETTRSGIINIAIKRSDLFISTIPNLYTFNIEEKLTTEFDMLSNNRAVNFMNRQQKFFFNFNSRFVPKPGSYRPLAMDLRSVGLIENITAINTSVEVTINSNNFFYMPGVKYNFRFNFEKSNNLMIGMNCNTLPGEYWLSFNHSDASLRLFERIPPIRVLIPFNLSKETVRLYFLEGNEITSSSNIQVGIDSVYVFSCRSSQCISYSNKCFFFFGTKYCYINYSTFSSKN